MTSETTHGGKQWGPDNPPAEGSRFGEDRDPDQSDAVWATLREKVLREHDLWEQYGDDGEDVEGDDE